MSALELVLLMLSSGVLSGGVGVSLWALNVEKRVRAIEVWKEVKFNKG
ncbi:hypothetical protein [Lacisediminimonas profundi]|nr:hypothetical protein [Lacisediminimonas profundi]